MPHFNNTSFALMHFHIISFSVWLVFLLLCLECIVHICNRHRFNCSLISRQLVPKKHTNWRHPQDMWIWLQEYLKDLHLMFKKNQYGSRSLDADWIAWPQNKITKYVRAVTLCLHTNVRYEGLFIKSLSFLSFSVFWQHMNSAQVKQRKRKSSPRSDTGSSKGL